MIGFADSSVAVLQQLGIEHRVLFLGSNGFDNWPFFIGKKCGVLKARSEHFVLLIVILLCQMFIISANKGNIPHNDERNLLHPIQTVLQMQKALRNAEITLTTDEFVSNLFCRLAELQ